MNFGTHIDLFEEKRFSALFCENIHFMYYAMIRIWNSAVLGHCWVETLRCWKHRWVQTLRCLWHCWVQTLQCWKHRGVAKFHIQKTIFRWEQGGVKTLRRLRHQWVKTPQCLQLCGVFLQFLSTKKHFIQAWNEYLVKKWSNHNNNHLTKFVWW